MLTDVRVDESRSKSASKSVTTVRFAMMLAGAIEPPSSTRTAPRPISALERSTSTLLEVRVEFMPAPLVAVTTHRYRSPWTSAADSVTSMVGSGTQSSTSVASARPP